MALNSSLDEGNSSSSTNSMNTAGDDWWNVTVPADLSSNSTLNNSTLDNRTVDDLAATNFTSDQTTSSPFPSASALPLNGTTNLTDSMTSLDNSTDSLSTSSASSPLTSPNAMRDTRQDSTSWKSPGVLIGLGCLVLGIVCVILGILIYLRKKRKSKEAVRRVRVMSGFDFNDGAEDDYQNNPWHKAHLDSDSNEKSGFDMTELNSYRHSNATMYSTGDDDEGESNRNFPHNHRIETGFAH